MARTRNIKPGFFKNEDLADLGPYAMILFEGLWCWADRKGVVENRPRMLKAEILPYFDVDVPSLLASLESKGFIVLYQVGEKSYVHIPAFASHQNPHQNEKDSGFPLPSDGIVPSNGASTPGATPGTEFKEGREEGGRNEGGKKKEEGRNKSKSPPVTIDDVKIPPDLDTAEVRASLSEWLEYHKASGKPYRSGSYVEKLFEPYVRAGPAAFVAAVNHSIANQYQGLFPAKDASGRSKPAIPIGAGQRYDPNAADAGKW